MKEPSHVEYLVISCIIPLIGLPGNLMLLGFSLRRRKHYHLTINEMLVSLLTLFNIIKIAIFMIISHAAYYTGTWFWGHLSCQIIAKLGAVVYLMSEFIIVYLVHIQKRVIMTEQFYMINSKKHAIFGCFVVFIISTALMCSPRFYDWNVVTYNSTTSNNIFVDVCKVKMEIWSTSIVFLLLIPAIYCITVVFMLRRKLKQSLAELNKHMQAIYLQARSKENKAVFIILGIMSFGFSITHVPLMVLHIIEYFEIEDEKQLNFLYSWYTFALFFLSALDTCTTPTAYLIFNKSFRRFFHRVVCCKQRMNFFRREKTFKVAKSSRSSEAFTSFTLGSLNENIVN